MGNFGITNFGSSNVNGLRFGTIGKEPDPYAVEQLKILGNLLSGKLMSNDWDQAEENAEDFGLYRLLTTPFLKKGKDNDLYEIIPNYRNDMTLRTFCEKRVPSLFFEFNSHFNDASSSLTFNQKQILSHNNIRDFLFLKAVYIEQLNNVKSIFSYMTQTGSAYLNVFQAVAVKASERIRDNEKIKLGHITASDRIIELLKGEEFSMEKTIFYNEIKNIINRMVFDLDNLDLISKVEKELGDIISDDDVPAILNYLKSSNIKIDAQNAKYFIPIAVNNLKNSNISYSSTSSGAASEFDFAVNYYEDDRASLEIIKENIVCASQLYYVMVLGDELGIFNIINYIATKKLPAGNMDIRNRDTLKDLQLYIFSESFKDLRNGEIFKRTLPAERMMFYKQVYSVGDEQTLEGMAVNNDYNRLWSILMKECVDYIQRVEDTTNSGYSISRQKIMQAIEDLQYNLSTHCTGMSKVATPIMYKEMDFVIERFMKNEEITRQISLGNSTSFWKVIERILFEMQGEVPNVAALRNKAVFGHRILSFIANYTPAQVADDVKFNDFLSTVEAFIIAESQLQDNPMDMRSEDPADNANGNMGGYPGMNGVNKNVPVGADDWNF
ncbi:MAG: hypothetical protein K1X55_03265 [Chitinophagales bacterium]|nr:hypothetical protein [Chitinophagales bacterium]